MRGEYFKLIDIFDPVVTVSLEPDTHLNIEEPLP